MTIAVVFSYLAGNESSGISQYSNRQDKVIFMNAAGDKPVGARIAAAEESGAKGVVVINKENPGKTINVANSTPLNIDYIVVSEAENSEALEKFIRADPPH